MDVLSDGMEAFSKSWTSFMEPYEEKESIFLYTVYIFNVFVYFLNTTLSNLGQDPDVEKSLNPDPDPLSVHFPC